MRIALQQEEVENCWTNIIFKFLINTLMHDSLVHLSNEIIALDLL